MGNHQFSDWWIKLVEPDSLEDIMFCGESKTGPLCSHLWANGKKTIHGFFRDSSWTGALYVVKNRNITKAFLKEYEHRIVK